MEKKFNVGDRVMCTDNGKLGAVAEIENDGDGCVVQFDDGEDTWIGCDMLELSKEPPYEPKTAFLSDLAAVLRKHNAVIIGGGFDGYGDYLQVRLGNESPFDVGEDNQYDGVVLTADNIMDFDKE